MESKESVSTLNVENIELLSNSTIKSKYRIFLLIKRIIDIIAGIIGVILLIPMTIIIYIANILTKDKGSIFYTQKRIGKDGKVFKMYKYRSMVVDADRKLNKYLKENDEAKEEYKKYKKLKEDPRITKVGKFIRKTSIDEFPQFINVLKGQMSLVGPRPYLRKEKEDIGKNNYQIIISVKPGITGYWQVNGRSSTDFDTRVKMDIDYIKTISLWGDFKFLIKTILMIFNKRDAI